MKLNKSIITGIIIFLIFWLTSIILEIKWISFIGLAIFLLISFFDVLKKGNKDEIKTQILLIVLIVIIQILGIIF